jgi:hypothetical protein
MEDLIKSMAHKVDSDEAVGCLVACCTRDLSGDYSILTSARVSRDFPSPYQLYVPLLGKLFHTIAQGHPEPETLLDGILNGALKQFRESMKDASETEGEFTVVGKL